MEITTEQGATRGSDAESNTAGPWDVWERVVRCMRTVVPFVDVEDIDRSVALQDEADLDSLDFVHLMAAVADETGVTVPERDYPLVATLDDLEAYVRAHAAPT